MNCSPRPTVGRSTDASNCTDCAAPTAQNIIRAATSPVAIRLILLPVPLCARTADRFGLAFLLDVAFIVLQHVKYAFSIRLRDLPVLLLLRLTLLLLILLLVRCCCCCCLSLFCCCC